MKFSKLLAVTLTLTSTLSAQQIRGTWRASSKNAQSITGDVAIAAEKIQIGFAIFPISQIRTLQPTELKAAFDLDGEAEGTGSFYKVNIPATQKFIKKNSLCGGETTEWMVAYINGHTLQLAFFSGAKPPTFTPDAIATTTDLCGTYTYSKKW
jgi:hypothetical protein